MLDPQKIPLSRVKEAYRLNEHEAQSLLHELSPEGVFPYELWQKAYASYWKSPAAECSRLYKVENPPFPETNQQPTKYCPTETYAKWMVDFFFEMARRISVSDLESGFNYIVESTYDSQAAVSESDREFLFYPLKLAEKNIANVARVEGVKNIDVRLSSPDVLLKIFPDTIAVDKRAAVYYLSVVQKYPFHHEVKGLTRAYVDSVIAVAMEEEIVIAPSSDAQKRKIPVPRSLWEGKTPEAACAAMLEKDTDILAIAHILFYRLKFPNKRAVSKMLYTDVVSDFAHDKRAAKLFKDSALITIIDVDGP
jgi:hypothetical protein